MGSHNCPPFRIGPEGRSWRRRILKRLAYDFGWTVNELQHGSPWPERTVEKDLRAMGIVRRSTKSNSLLYRYRRYKALGWTQRRISRALRIPLGSIPELERNHG